MPPDPYCSAPTQPPPLAAAWPWQVNHRKPFFTENSEQARHESGAFCRRSCFPASRQHPCFLDLRKVAALLFSRRVTFTVQQHPYYSAHSCLNLLLDAAHFVAIVPHAVPNILIAPVEPLGQRNYVPLVIVGHRVRKLHLVAVEWNRVWIKQNKRSPRRFCFGGLMRKMRIRTGIRPWARGDSSSLHAWRCGYRTHSP